MRIFKIFLIISSSAIAFAGNGWSQSNQTSPMTVKYVDLKRYAGKWYEISKIPNRFQRQCAGNTTAQYTIRDDGKIDVINRCKKEDGTTDEAIGIAKVDDPESNAKLKVSFVRFLWRSWFWGDYWILALGKEYEFAIVGTPSRKYGWILSRTPEMDPNTYRSVIEKLKEQGYDPNDFELTSH